MLRSRNLILFALASGMFAGPAAASPRAFAPTMGIQSDLLIPAQYRDYFDDGGYDDDYDRRDRRYGRGRDRYDQNDSYERRDRGSYDRRDRDSRNRGDDRRGNEQPKRSSQKVERITDPNDPRLKNTCQLLPNEPICRHSRWRAR